MKNVLIAITLLAVSSFAMAGNAEYKLTRIQYTASDGVRYDTARRNLHIVDSQAIIKRSTFFFKSEIVVGNYLNSDRDTYEKYSFTVNGSNVRLVDSSGRVSNATILRSSPLRLQFDTGVILSFRQVAYTGRDRNPHITTIQTVNGAIDNVVENEREIGPIGL